MRAPRLLAVLVLAGCGSSAEDATVSPLEDARVVDDTARPTVDLDSSPTIDSSRSEDVVVVDATAVDASAPTKEDCTKYPFDASVLLSERVGFGAKTTGGDPTKLYWVKTLADSGPGSLRSALDSTEPWWIVFDPTVKGVIKLATKLEIRSNKTIDGRGRDITIDGNLKIELGTRNVIMSDVKLQYPEGFATSTGDLVSLRGNGHANAEDYETKDFWFHHLELARGGDGQIDVRGATDITISWCHLHSHSKAFLHSYDTKGDPSPGMHITYHHDWFEKISRRGPQFHYGLADFFNNYQFQWYEFGATSQREAQFLSEANVYEARPGDYCIPACPDPNSPTGDGDFTVSKKALVSGWDAPKGFVRSVKDLAQNGAKIEEYEPTKVFARSTFYSAIVEPADEALKKKIATGSGPRRSYCK